MTPRVLVVAGSDSGGGAGIQADLKTIAMLGGHATCAVTAVTAQNTMGVSGVHAIPTGMVMAQIDAVASDIGLDAVKIGMIGSAETAHAMAKWLERAAPARGIPVVFDPVMVASSGSVLADGGTVEAFGRLMRAATVVTPNLPELFALAGREGEPEALATELAATHGCLVLAKGGHGAGEWLTDALVGPDGVVARWTGARIDTPHTHGTGCTLASALAVGLARGFAPELAAAGARGFVRFAMRDAPGFGAGHGPLGQQAVRLDLALDERPMLNQITLPASDYAASVGFYRALGLQQIVDTPPRYARFDGAGGMTLSVEVSAPPVLPATAQLFLQCCDLDATVERLEKAGVTIALMPENRSYLWRVAELADPHGNPIRLYDPAENRRFPPWRVMTT